MVRERKRGLDGRWGRPGEREYWMGMSCRPWASAVAILACLLWVAPAHAQAPAASDFQKVTLDDNTQNPMELDVANDGRVFYIERDGRLQIWKPNTQQTVTAGTVPVTRSQENGLLGLQLAPDFDTSRWVYLFYSQLPDNTLTAGRRRASRSTATRSTSPPSRRSSPSSTRRGVLPLLRLAVLRPGRQPLHLDGRQHEPVRLRRLQPDRRALRPHALGRAAHGGQHQRPQRQDPAGQAARDPTGTPGVGTTYTIPAGNLFPEARTRHKTRPEIFGMGFRNPFRFTVDPDDGLGALARTTAPTPARPTPTAAPRARSSTTCSRRRATTAGRTASATTSPYNDFDFATRTSGAEVRLRRAGQRLAQQHGPAPTCRRRIGATRLDGLHARRTRALPGLGTGGAPMGGPRYHFDAEPRLPRKFPAFYDNKWFIAEWNNGWIKTADLSADRRDDAPCRPSRSARATSVRWTSTSVLTAPST